MRPLATRTYLLRNRNKTLPLIGVIVLAVMLICAIVSLINSIPLSVRTIYRYSATMMGVTPRGDADNTPALRQIIEAESPVPIERIAVVRASDTEVRSIVGRWQFATIALQAQDVQYMLDRLDTRRLEGRKPAVGQPEAIISEPVARNLGLRLGDTLLSPENPDMYSPFPVKIVGIAHTDQWVMLSDYTYYVAHHFPPIDLLLVFSEDLARQPELDTWAMERFRGERARILSYLEVEKNAAEMFRTLYRILDVVIGTLVIVLTVMMGMLINIYLSQRTQEFALLQALGYTKSALIRRVVWETIAVVVGGWILGVAMAIGMLNVVDQILMHPNAFAIDITDQAALTYTIPVPLAILAVALLTLWNRFRHFDPVGVVERRLV